MLYDPKWEIQTKADPLSLESLIAWLEKQYASRTYDYINSANCLLCQYFRAVGIPVFSLSQNHYRLTVHAQRISFPHIFHQISLETPWTFGGALDRAREAASKHSVPAY